MSEIIEMIPLVGVKIGGKEICFGDPEKKMEEALGAPQSIKEDSYFDSEL